MSRRTAKRLERLIGALHYTERVIERPVLARIDDLRLIIPAEDRAAAAVERLCFAGRDVSMLGVDLATHRLAHAERQAHNRAELARLEARLRGV